MEGFLKTDEGIVMSRCGEIELVGELRHSHTPRLFPRNRPACGISDIEGDEAHRYRRLVLFCPDGHLERRVGRDVCDITAASVVNHHVDLR